MKRSPRVPTEKESRSLIPKTIMGYVSVAGPQSLFGAGERNIPTTARPFRAKATDRKAVGRALEKIGFTIIAESRLGFAVAGPAEAYEELTAGRVRMREKLLRPGRFVTHVDIAGPKQPREIGVARARSARLPIDGIALDQHRRHLAISAQPPTVDAFYLKLPRDVAKGLRADRAHMKGARGAGVRVAMPDTGMASHPFYAKHGYQLLVTQTALPGVPPDQDPEGHGTGECANIFAIAPECEVLPIRCSDDTGKIVAGIAGFTLAKERNVPIITCSWSADLDIDFNRPTPRPPDLSNAILGEILDAVDKGIVVVFAAGNGTFGLEPQIPGVLAAGGVFMSKTGAIRTSNLASAYKSPWFPGSVPTVCGLAGLMPDENLIGIPFDQYIMMPVAPGSFLDVRHAGDPADPDTPADGTTPGDGWARFSGTSAAAPQLAGAAAALLSAKPNLKAAQIIEALVETARDVTVGNCNPSFKDFTPDAGPGPDVATGHGLVDVGAALAYAKNNFP